MVRRIIFPCLLLLFLAPQVQAETFSEQLRTLVDTHKRILATKATVDSLTEGAIVSKKAYWPEVSVTALTGHESRKNIEGTLDTGLGASEFDASITQPLDWWNSKRAAYEIAGLQLEQGKLGLEQTIQSVILEAITATIGLNTATLIEEYARQSVSNIKTQAQLEDARVAKGSGLSTDVLQAKIQLAGAEARLTLATGALKQAINRYRAVFGYEPPDRSALPAVTLPLSRIPTSKDECVKLALENNFQIRSLRSAEEVARTSVKQTVADQFRPSLNFIVDSKVKNNISGIRGSTNEWIAKLEMKYTFNVGGSSLNSLNSSEYNLSASSNQLQDATNLVEEQAKNTFEQYEIAQQNAAFLDNQANIASEFLALAREERRLGTRSLIDVLSGETAEINALSDAEGAKSQVAIAAYTLLFILGELDVEAVEVAGNAALPRNNKVTADAIEPENQSNSVQAGVNAHNTDRSLVLHSPENATAIGHTQYEEPEAQSSLLEVEAMSQNADPSLVLDQPSNAEKNNVVQSREPAAQPDLIEAIVLPPAEEQLAALAPLPEPEIVTTDVASDLPESEISVARAQNSTQLKDSLETPRIDRVPTDAASRVAPTRPVEVVAEMKEIQPTTPASPDLEKTENGPKVMVGVLRDITSEDPNFQRQWAY